VSTWDPARTAKYFDELDEGEWTRFERGITPGPSVAIHTQMLEGYVRPGDRVLDAGCGPGRFTLELLRLGAHVTALDISPGQLELLRARVPDIDAVVGDITDLSRFPGDAFDVTVCFGGPLSYVVDRAEQALAELARVTRPGGHLLVSVMGLAGAVIHYAPIIAELARRDGPAKSREVARTGFLPEGEGYGHIAMQM
jgi:SAM-dependent methyltransferase